MRYWAAEHVAKAPDGVDGLKWTSKYGIVYLDGLGLDLAVDLKKLDFSPGAKNLKMSIYGGTGIVDNIPGSNIPYVPTTESWNIPYKDQITIEQLLQHNAGVKNQS